MGQTLVLRETVISYLSGQFEPERFLSDTTRNRHVTFPHGPTDTPLTVNVSPETFIVNKERHAPRGGTPETRET